MLAFPQVTFINPLQSNTFAGGSNAVSTMHCIAMSRFESKHALLKAILGKALTIVRKAFLDINLIKASTDGNKIDHTKKQR